MKDIKDKRSPQERFAENRKKKTPHGFKNNLDYWVYRLTSGISDDVILFVSYGFPAILATTLLVFLLIILIRQYI